MGNRLDTEMDAALRDIVNAPAAPGEALVASLRAAGEKKRRERRKAAALWAAGGALALNAALSALLALRAVQLTGPGLAAAAAALAGMMLMMLPSVLLLSAGELLPNLKRK